MNSIEQRKKEVYQILTAFTKLEDRLSALSNKGFMVKFINISNYLSFSQCYFLKRKKVHRVIVSFPVKNNYNRFYKAYVVDLKE